VYAACKRFKLKIKKATQNSPIKWQHNRRCSAPTITKQKLETEPTRNIWVSIHG
jgi:hypothetical protein